MPPPLPSQPDIIGFTDDELANLARRHRSVIVAWLAACLVLVLFCLTSPQLTPSAAGLGGVHSARLALFIGVHAWLVVTVLRLRRAVGDDWFIACFIAAWCALPFANVVIVQICVLDAVQVLRVAFGKVPVLGLSASALAARQGCCRECGYDLRGLKDTTCPECGAPSSRRAATDRIS